MRWSSATVRDEAVKIPANWLHLHYYEALNVLFRAENALRIFVYVVLKSRFKERWVDAQIQTIEEEQTTISAVAAKRIAQARGFGYLGYEINAPLLYLNSGELTRLITSDTYWDAFKPFFKGKRDVIKTKLDEVSAIRNSLAHFRPIRSDDVELIKQNIKHAFAGIDDSLNEMLGVNQVVPTNTSDDWYKALSSLGTTLCEIQLFQNKTDKWIGIEITYACPISKIEKYSDDYQTYAVLNLMSPAIIRESAEIARYCTFANEYVPYASMSPDRIPKFSKRIYIIFNKNILREHFDAVATDLRALLSRIEIESELVQKDNLARGAFVESATSYSVIREDADRRSWHTSTDNLRCEFGEDDPPEYWGEIGQFVFDFITSTHRYPWMPSDIAKQEIPF